MGWISNTQLISILEATQQVPDEILQELRKKNDDESLLETAGGLIPSSVQNDLQSFLKTLKQTSVRPELVEGWAS